MKKLFGLAVGLAVSVWPMSAGAGEPAVSARVEARSPGKESTECQRLKAERRAMRQSQAEEGRALRESLAGRPKREARAALRALREKQKAERKAFHERQKREGAADCARRRARKADRGR